MVENDPQGKYSEMILPPTGRYSSLRPIFPTVTPTMMVSSDWTKQMRETPQKCTRWWSKEHEGDEKTPMTQSWTGKTNAGGGTGVSDAECMENKDMGCMKWMEGHLAANTMTKDLGGCVRHWLITVAGGGDWRWGI